MEKELYKIMQNVNEEMIDEMGMSKQDFIPLAAALKKHKAAEGLKIEIADICARANSNFDRERFMAACAAEEEKKEPKAEAKAEGHEPVEEAKIEEPKPEVKVEESKIEDKK